MATLREETVTAERFLGKKSNKTIGKRTRRTTKTRVRTKNSTSTEEGVPRNQRVHRTKITISLHRTKTIVKAKKTINERTIRTTKARRGKKNRSSTERSEPSNLSVNRTKATISASKTTNKRSRRTTKTREVRKSRISTEGGEPSNLRVHRIKVNASANTKKDTEAIKLNTSRAGVKQSTSTTVGIHEPTLNSYKLISFNSKGAYYESPMYVTEQVKWEYTLMCMCDWKLIGRCMIDVHLKLCVWNCYPRKLVMSNVNNVGMMYDVTNIKTLTITTTIGKHHSSELRSFKMLKHACEFMNNQKICNSITKTVNNVLHDLLVIKKIHVVCKDCYAVKLNQTISTNLYSKAKIQLSPQIKLWGGYGLRGNRKTSSTKLWKCSYFISISLYIGKNMAAVSTTNVDLEMGMVDENEINNFSQKRPTMAQVTISQKKAKGKMVVEPKRPPFWLGFQAMNWTNRSKDYPIDKMELISELIRKGMEIDEATKCQQATPSFPFVIQEQWPSIRGDGIEGQHFNLTQIPFDVEVDENGFALDYQIAIAFEIGDLKVSKENVMEKVKERLKKMKIAIGSMIGEPIAIMCYHKSTTWSGVVKIHLKNPKKDRSALLQGSKAFILNLDEKMDRRGKVCKTYDALALNNLLSVKIMSEKLKEKDGIMFLRIL